MIELTYISGCIRTFEIYNESNNHIIWKDSVDNLIRINKKTNHITMFHDGEWIDYDSQIMSYRVI